MKALRRKVKFIGQILRYNEFVTNLIEGEVLGNIKEKPISIRKEQLCVEKSYFI